MLPIFVNPRSRQHRKNPELADKYLKVGNGQVEILKPSDFKALAKAAEYCKKKKYGCVAISGGDGTIHQVVTALVKAYTPKHMPRILLLGDGTMNNIANSVGIKGGGKRVILAYLKHHGHGIVQYRNTLEIGGKYCFIFGCGMVSNFLVEVYRGNKGLVRNLIVIRRSVSEVIRSLFTKNHETLALLKPLSADVYVSGKKISCEQFSAILAGTVEKIGMGFKPLSKASVSDDMFHLIAAGVSPAKILLNLAPIAMGKGFIISDCNYVDVLVSDVTIKSKKPFEYTMDGDMYTSKGKLDIGMGPSVAFIKV
jgi:diacylglycerol kinase family enzyme